jgi:hypothetical protein
MIVVQSALAAHAALQLGMSIWNDGVPPAISSVKHLVGVGVGVGACVGAGVGADVQGVTSDTELVASSPLKLAR